jgi:transcriptional regulator with XRE-family HTH domain
LADKLNHLFATVRPAGRGPFTHAEVGAATGLAPTHIGYLRTGERDNPTVRTLESLARFFGVPVSYFLNDDDTRRIDEQLRQLQSMAALQQALKRDGVQQLATRMGDLTDGSIAAIAQLVDLLLDKEHHHPGRPDD